MLNRKYLAFYILSFVTAEKEIIKYLIREFCISKLKTSDRALYIREGRPHKNSVFRAKFTLVEEEMVVTKFTILKTKQCGKSFVLS